MLMFVQRTLRTYSMMYVYSWIVLLVVCGMCVAEDPVGFIGCYNTATAWLKFVGSVSSMNQCRELCVKEKYLYSTLRLVGLECYCTSDLTYLVRDDSYCGHCDRAGFPVCAKDDRWRAAFSAACQPGNWGKHNPNLPVDTICAFNCGHCQDNAVCDDVTGQCPDNLCEPGWKPPNCDHQVEDFRYIGCFIDNNGWEFTTTQTESGYAVTDCLNQCIAKGNKYAGMAYSFFTDEKWCYCGDTYDYYGPGAGCMDCSHDSSLKCGGRLRASVYSAACPQGFWGLDVQSVCSKQCNCKDGAPCDNNDGTCPDGCAPGWTGSACDQDCPPDKYGINCSKECRIPGYCDHKTGCFLNGTCPEPEAVSQCTMNPSADGCREGSTVSAPLIAGIAAAILILLTIGIVLLIIFIYCKKRTKNDELTRDSEEELPSSYADNNGLPNTGSLDNQEGEEISEPGNAPQEVIEDEAVYLNVKRLQHIELSDLQLIVQQERGRQEPFKEEYEGLPRGQLASWEAATQPKIKKKNRFKNIYPYDHSRVKLREVEGDPFSDYINANYIKGYREMEQFIAAQGPTPDSVVGFWRMIWEQSTGIVVMLTNPVEAGKRKCDIYWPDSSERKSFGEFEVTVENVLELPDFTIRDFSVKLGHSTRKVKQFHFTTWPDHGVPQHATELLNFRSKVRAEMERNEDLQPVIIHCSAGIGRTGAYIAIDHLIQQAEAEEHIDVISCIQSLRKDRINMVQTREQYTFVYTALLEAVWIGETRIPCYKFQDVFPTMLSPDPYSSSTKLEQQFLLLESLKPTVPKSQYSVALAIENKDKNRSLDLLPENKAFPMLMTQVENQTNYINAIFAAGRSKGTRFIATQMPLSGTIVDFWRMVYDYKCSCIVMLNKGNSDEEKVGQYWPDEINNPVTYGPFTITLEKDVNEEGFLIRHMNITHEKKKTSVKVNQYYYSRWPSEGSPGPIPAGDLFRIYDSVKHWQKNTVTKKTWPGPIVVHCLDGVEQCGVFLAMCNLCDMMSVEQELDVFQVVQTIRKDRPQFITSQVQYRYLYDVSKEFMDTFSTYSNFQ